MRKRRTVPLEGKENPRRPWISTEIDSERTIDRFRSHLHSNVRHESSSHRTVDNIDAWNDPIFIRDKRAEVYREYRFRKQKRTRGHRL